ncbi:MAG: protein phosphatase 2C domain-containing protein [Burkholderiaceae bacterium]|nr:protein phosphatase 2C domain-containing protein [Burkholderiaceae bacterium]
MQCPKCSAELVENQRFCEECGTRISAAAPLPADTAVCRCAPGSALPNANGFCENCGFKLAAPVPAVGAVKYDYPPDLGLVSDRGRVHPINQDAGIVGRSPSGAVAIAVADGVSSSDQAEVASATAVAAAYREMVEAPADLPGEEIVRRAVAAAHAAVMNIPYTNTPMEEPETTIVVALVRGSSTSVAWVGDSRAYTISTAYSRLVTRDDSWLADVVEEGHMTLEQALADNRSHSITQCLGMLDGEIRIHVRNLNLEPDTWLLLCTDGLWNYFDQTPAMAQAVAAATSEADAFELCQHLVKLANQAGGHDNITAGAYRIGSSAGVFQAVTDKVPTIP